MNKPEDTFKQLLGLGEEWNVERSHYDEKASVFELHVQETSKLWITERCPADGNDGITCYDHVEEMSWRHLNVFSKECVILSRLPRGLCPKCGKVYRVTPPWEGRAKHFTKEFEAFALTLMREMPVNRAADILGETDTKMWRVVHGYVDLAYQQLSMKNVTSVGVDEMSRRKGHQYLSVFCDMLERRVLFATPGKGAETWDAFSEALHAHKGKARCIKNVSMDMSPSYISGVKKNCKNAEIVFDKFHVIMNANEAVDLVRRAEFRKGNVDVREQLKKSRWLWLKNPKNLTEAQEEHMDRIDHDMIVTSKAYQMRLALQKIYNCKTAAYAAKRFAAWCRWVRKQAAKTKWGLLNSMVKIANMIESHAAGILAHWDGRLTNAFMEGLNSVFSAVKRRARGFRTVRNIVAMLYFVAGKLPEPKPVFH